jgi:hypothetical protein
VRALAACLLMTLWGCWGYWLSWVLAGEHGASGLFTGLVVLICATGLWAVLEEGSSR